MKKLDRIEQLLWEKSERLASESYHAYVKNIHERLYLYIREKNLMVASDIPSGFRLAESETIPRNYTLPQLVHWFKERLGRLPIL